MNGWNVEYINRGEEKYWAEMRLGNKKCTVYIYLEKEDISSFRISIFDRGYDHGGKALLDNWFRIGTGVGTVETVQDGWRITELFRVKGIELLENAIVEKVTLMLIKDL